MYAQSCPTLYDPMDCSPRGSSVCGDSPGKNTGVGCHFLLQGSWHRDQIWSPALQADSLPLSHQGSFQVHFISEHWPLEMLLWTQKTEQTCISVSVENSNYRLLHRVERNLFIYDVKRVGKSLPAALETWVQSLGWEDLLEKGKATNSSILTRRIPWTI